MKAFLTVESGQAEPRECSLEADRPVTLGRHRKNALVLHDEHASRWHAEIFFSGGQWFIRDTGTLNGTRLNGAMVTQQTALEHGQVIGIGQTTVRFTLESSRNGHAAKTAAELHLHPGNPAQPTGSSETILQHDELTVLCHFMAGSVRAPDAHSLILTALEVVSKQLKATICGFLSLDPQVPLPKVLLPKSAQVDVQLSRQLTLAVQKSGRAVWLSANQEVSIDSESLVSFADAICIPLLVAESPLGALHVYRSNELFSERDLRFCEVLGAHLASSLHVLRVQRTLAAENSRLRGHSRAADQLIGNSASLATLRSRINRLAPGRSPVLIVGESGVGKELVALALHRQSPRREAPLVSVNCAAITPSLLESELFGHRKGAFSGAERDRQGLFQQADEGMLFLDEIGELSSECQAKLLRVVEGKGFRPVGEDVEIQVDVRILAATNRKLQAEVEAGRFRHDLFYRLEGIQIQVPPLREHAEDIADLVEYFLQRLNVEWSRQVRISPAALERLRSYSWPGNIRQLRSVLESAVALSDKPWLEACDLVLPENLAGESLDDLNLEALEARAIRTALTRAGGNITESAQLLGVGRESLYGKMRRLGINRET